MFKNIGQVNISEEAISNKWTEGLTTLNNKMSQLKSPVNEIVKQLTITSSKKYQFPVLKAEIKRYLKVDWTSTRKTMTENTTSQAPIAPLLTKD